MKNGDERKSCFVASTHSHSPFISAGSATARPGPGDADPAPPSCVATSSATAVVISSRCLALYRSRGAYADCWNKSCPRSVSAERRRIARLSSSGDFAGAVAEARHEVSRCRQDEGRANERGGERGGERGRRHRLDGIARVGCRNLWCQGRQRLEDVTGNVSFIRPSSTSHFTRPSFSKRTLRYSNPAPALRGSSFTHPPRISTQRKAARADRTGWSPAIEPPSPRRSLALVRRRPPRAPQSPRRGAPRAGAFRQSSALPRAVPKGEQRGRDELAVPEGVQHPRWVPAGPQVVHARGAFAFSRAPSPVVCVPRPEKGRPESARARARASIRAPIRPHHARIARRDG